MIDLHAHTDCSDGTLTPLELVQQARLAGLRALAITDHDTFAGYEAAQPLAARHSLELVCGLELSTVLTAAPGHRRTTVHVLGYFLRRPPAPEFKDWLTTISATRHDRNLSLMAHLRKNNIHIDWPDLPLPPESAGRVHFARLLVARGLADSHQDAFDRYLSDAALPGIERRLPDVAEGIGKIRAAGGIPSLAHPVRLPFRGAPELKPFLQEMAGCGLQALEVHHSDHTPEDANLFQQLALDLGLLPTGGSDFHGDNKPGIALGKGRGGLRVPYALLEQLRSLV